jgi:hypothetical protein
MLAVYDVFKEAFAARELFAAADKLFLYGFGVVNFAPA